MPSWRLGVVVIAALLATIATTVPSVGVSSPGARRVARRAHHKALGITPPPSGVRHFSWHGWQVTGDLRGSTDRYLATRGPRRVRWLF